MIILRQIELLADFTILAFIGILCEKCCSLPDSPLEILDDLLVGVYQELVLQLELEWLAGLDAKVQAQVAMVTADAV